MRDYVLSQAEILDRGISFGRLQRLFRNWRRRRQVADLLDKEDRILEDVGLSRADIQQTLSRPLDLDPVWELERLTLARRRASSRGWRSPRP